MSDVPTKPTVLHSFKDLAIPSPSAQMAKDGATVKNTPPPASGSTGRPTPSEAWRGNAPLHSTRPVHDYEMDNRRAELDRVTRILADKERENKQLKYENERLRPILAQIRASCDVEKARLAALTAEADRIASGLPDARLAAIKEKEDRIADREAQIERDLAEAANISDLAKAEAATVIRTAQDEADLLRSAAQTECDLKKQDLAARESDLAQRAADIEAPLKEAERSIRSLQRALKTSQERIAAQDAEAATLQAKSERLTKRLAERTRELAEREAERDAAQSELATANGKARRLQRELESAEESIASGVGRLFAHCPLVSEWLAGMEEPTEDLNWTKEVATTGSDPFQVDFIDKLLHREDHTVHTVGDEDAGVLIVGRDGWTADELQEQIDAREGNTLRIYSQEMAALALLTGHDPFDAGEAVLLEMGKGHPALEHLMENPFKWPSIGEGYGGNVYIDGDLWRKQSPLTAMGYHVGVTSALSDGERRKLLGNIFKGRLVFPDDFSEYEKREWGQSGTSARLQKMASHIVGNISLHAPRLGYDSVAVNEWKGDLTWLKKTFFTTSLRFRWPDTIV